MSRVETRPGETPFRVLNAAAIRAFGPLLRIEREAREDTKLALRSARIPMFPEWYLALGYFCGAAGAVLASLGTGVVLTLVGFSWGGAVAVGAVLVVGAGAAGFLAVQLVFLLYPRLVASGRARKIDQEFPSVVTLCYALAQGGMNATEIFRVVAEEKKIYGEISREFGQVVRDVDTFGEDLLTALKNGAATTPSRTLRGFFEGLVTMLNSGADPRDYFKRQATTQISMSETKLENDMEQASLLAEIYVSALLVLPILVIVVLAGLSVLGNVGVSAIPLIIFGLIPLGTLSYLLLLEVMLPSESLRNPKPEGERLQDFGVETLSRDETRLSEASKTAFADAADEERGLRRRVRFERTWRRAKQAWRVFALRAIEKPADAIEFSGIIALIVLFAGAVMYFTTDFGAAGFAVEGATLVLAATAVAVIPVSIFHEARVFRARRVDNALPEMIGKLAGFNERGIGILQSFKILGNATTGPMAREMRSFERDVTWTGHLAGALRRLRQRVNTLNMTKLAVLLQRATAATGNLKDVLDIAAADATRTQHLRNRRRQGMFTYTIVIYVVFAVFLYILYTVANLFYGPEGFGAAAASAAANPTSGLAGGLAPETAKLYFFYGALIQGVCAGLVAGRLGEGYHLSGLKHAVILVGVAFLVFRLGVLA